MSDMSQVGLYANAQKTIRLVLTLITSLGVVMLPRMSSLYSEGKMDEFKAMIYKAFNFVNFMAFPMVFGLIAIADGFSLSFYGANFAGVGVLLQVGVLIIIAISWSNILGIQVMLPMDRERGFTISVVGGAVVNVIFNFILIIHYKAMGTTIASVIAEFTVTAIQIYLLRDVVKLGRIIKTAIKPLIGSIVMFLVIKLVERFVSKGIIATVIEVAVGVIVYIVVMIIITSQFIKEVNSIVKTKILKR